MARFQIRDDDFGLALVDGDDAREALLAFVSDRVKGDIRPTVEESADGAAQVVYAGVRYRAVPVASGPPTDSEIAEAERRLAPYFDGYPEPMIDTRRLRIASGSASEQDRREIAAEDEVIRRRR